MKKLKLNLEDLKVEAFLTQSKGSISKGTVNANATLPVYVTCEPTCPQNTDVEWTCPNWSICPVGPC